MLRVNTVFNGPPGAPYYSTFYFGGTTEGEAAAAVTATDGFWEAFAAGLRADMGAIIAQEVERVDPASGNILEIFSTAGGTVDFTNAADPLPTANQLLIRWRTNVFAAGREIRGRTFIPGYCETSNTAGFPTASTLSGSQAAAVALGAAATPAGGLVVYSPTNGQMAPVSASSVWSQWAVMRSRRD